MAFRYPARIDYSQPQPPQVADAIATQKKLYQQVRLNDDFGIVKTIAGVDVGYDLKRELTKAVVAVLDFETLELQTSVIAYAATDFPYISGLLAFREIPAILKALDCLPIKPDILMVDGQGIAHPRRLGIAAHLGVLTGLPAIGVAKSRLCGKHSTLSQEKFARTPLTDKGEIIGTVLQSKERCNPLYISAGHRIDQKSALELTLKCFKGYRLPEPTRIADQISKWSLAADEKNPPQFAEDLFGMKDV
jgi:deoxyribonuclease V